MDRIEKLIEVVRTHYENGDPGHDFAHIMRVVGTCKNFGSELGADLQILIPAALLHDVVNLPKDHPDRKLASQKAAEESQKILKSLDYSKEVIESVTKVIAEHSYSLGKKPSCVESSILQDVDRLDALGAIGIMRTVTCGCRLGASYYEVKDPLAKNRELNDRDFTIDHFFTKLFKLPDTLNTLPAKKEAARRIQFMKSFMSQLETEIWS